jgi:hypothetical protein
MSSPSRALDDPYRQSARMIRVKDKQNIDQFLMDLSLKNEVSPILNSRTMLTTPIKGTQPYQHKFSSRGRN